MFTLRDQARTDYSGTLSQIAAAGYNAVEAAFGYGELSASALRKVLDDVGVRIIATHVGVDRLRSHFDDEVEFSLAVGNPNVLLAELPLADRTDEAAFHRWAADLQRMGHRCRELGARFSYHSHAFEFRRFGHTTGLEILLGETDPEAVGWEPDVYWITFAGEDPVAWISRYADRSRLIHLKDMKDAPLPDNPIDANARDLAAHLSAALGEGTIDETPAVVAATHAEWLIVEQDFSEGPMLDSIARSRRHLSARGF
jgi:sugar phosphate isomerase/epimerase